MRTLGIDIGTTTISAVVFDAEQKQTIAAKTIPNDSFLPSNQVWERIQDVKRIVTKAKAVLDELLDQYGEIEAIGLTCQMHGILYADEQGVCQSPLYTWQDGRGNLPFGEEAQETYAAWLSRTTGYRAASGYGLVTHFYHQNQQSVPVRAVKLCTIGDYFAMVLTGRRTPLMHATNAASLGLFDVRRGCFDAKALAQAGIDPAILPEVVLEPEVVGRYRERPVTTAIGDNQASFLGAAGTDQEVLLVNMGTGGQISVLSEQFLESPGIEARPFLDGRYLLAGASLCGGKSYAILEQFFCAYQEAAGRERSSQYAVMGRLAQEEECRQLQMDAAQRSCLQVQTTFSGTREDPDQRGWIGNISADNFTPGALIYGVMEGMVQELYELFLVIQKGTGIEVRRMIASGNGLRKNEVLCRLFQRKLGAALTLASCEEEAACGAAISSKMK